MRHKTLIMASIVWMLSAAALADEAPRVIMENVIVSATKTEEQRKDIPNAVTAKDAFDIQAAAARSVGELLANEPGIDWRTYGNYGGAAQQIRIRGMNANGTQVLINGIGVNSPSLGGADIGKIPLNAIQRIEVVKGSGSVLYGSGAMGGTVNIITKEPLRERADFKASAGYGTEKSYQLAVEQGMFVTPAIGYYLTGSRLETDGFRDNSDLTHNDISLKLLLDKGPLWGLTFYGDYVEREFGRPGAQPPPGTPTLAINGERLYNADAANLLDRGRDRDGHVALELRSSPSDALNLTLKSNYMDMQSYNYNRYYDSFSTPIGLPGSKTWVTNRVWSSEADVEFRPWAGASLLVGADYKNYDWRNENVNLDDSGREIAAATTRTTAGLHTKSLFAEAQYRPWKYLKGLAGLRQERHALFGTETIGRYGIVINPFATTALKINHGKHFNAPTPNDLFWPREDWGGGMGTQGNRNLRPETGWHTDVTLEQSCAAEKLFFSVGYFHWDVDDKIRWVPDAAFFYQPRNLDHYEADGWEIETKVGPFHDTLLALGYTYIDAQEEYDGGTARAALYTAKQNFKADLTHWFTAGLDVTLTVRYTGRRPAYYAADADQKPDYELDAYWTTDIKLQQKLFTHWLLTLQGNNIFNKGHTTFVENFTDQTSGVTTLAGYPGAERSVFVSLSYQF